MLKIHSPWHGMLQAYDAGRKTVMARALMFTFLRSFPGDVKDFCLAAGPPVGGLIGVAIGCGVAMDLEKTPESKTPWPLRGLLKSNASKSLVCMGTGLAGGLCGIAVGPVLLPCALALGCCTLANAVISDPDGKGTGPDPRQS